MRCAAVMIMVLMGVFVATAQSDVDAELESLLFDYVYEDEPGVVLYVNYAGDEWVGTAGLANLETGAQIQMSDLFRIGSITKPLVATVLLQLVEEGQMRLDDPLAAYLPDEIAANIVNADDATVRQMLQMTSGIFDYIESEAFDDAIYAGSGTMWTAETAIQYAFDETPYFAAGNDFYYSNSNYLLAEIMIENVTGQSLAVALEARIFDPAGMTSCFVETPDRFAEGIVRGYAFFDEVYEDITEINDGVGMGDGGVICNAADLAKFPSALWNNTFLSDEVLADMFTTVGDGDGGAYGLGIDYGENEFGLIQIGHAGSTSGFNANLVYIPDEDLVVVVMTNNFDSEIIEDLTIEAQAIALDF